MKRRFWIEDVDVGARDAGRRRKKVLSLFNAHEIL
jgi:hypothetical protein